MHVVGTHLQADGGSFDGGSTRILQMQEIRQWIKSFRIPYEEPIIMAGDLNFDLGSEVGKFNRKGCTAEPPYCSIAFDIFLLLVD